LNVSEILPQYSKNLQKLYFDKNEIIGEHSICNFSTNFLGGREIDQEGGKILPKVFSEL